MERVLQRPQPNRVNVHVIPQRLWRHAQGWHKFKPDGAPVRRGVGGTGLDIPRLSPMTPACKKKKKTLFSNEASLGVLTTLTCLTRAQQKIANTNLTQLYCCRQSVLYSVAWAFFPIGFLLVICL